MLLLRIGKAVALSVDIGHDNDIVDEINRMTRGMV